MGKLGVFNIVLVLLAVYVSAKYTYDKQGTNIDGEIDAIADALFLRDVGGDDGDDSDDSDDSDDDCQCTSICDCLDEDCEPDFCDDIKRELGTDLTDGNDEDAQARAVGDTQKKILTRFRFRRFRIPPRIRRFPGRIRFRPRFRRFRRFRLGKK